jgi:cyclopropane-fatty-acyl-phospholipid synthase
MERALQSVFESVVRKGTLKLTLASGRAVVFGDGPGVSVAVRFTTPRTQRQILIDPDLRLGEAFADGSLVMEQGSIADLLGLVLSQGHATKRPAWTKLLAGLRYLLRRTQQSNGRHKSIKNVHHHYDLDTRLYDLFLDADRQYSCGYFEHHGQSLDEAQVAKKRHIAAKLLIRPGTEVLDIGSGWGGLALYLSEICGARTTGITLSEEQLAVSRIRTRERGLSDRAQFRLEDYRDQNGRYDRIVSVGMFEHVGVGHYDAYFGKCAELLPDDGVMLLHSIGRSDGPGITNPWIAKYIFPGGYIPSLSETLASIERSGLLATDVEILRLHYAETLKHWRQRFLAHRDEAVALYGERFARIWEFYLAASEMSFRKQGVMVFQIQLTKRQNVVPTTRDYIASEEQRLRGCEGLHQRELRFAAE